MLILQSSIKAVIVAGLLATQLTLASAHAPEVQPDKSH